jgi:hypothetical protein
MAKRLTHPFYYMIGEKTFRFRTIFKEGERVVRKNEVVKAYPMI